MNDKYESPFSKRYASKYMLELFSDDTRYKLWRTLWYELAKVEHDLGLNISEEQLEDLKKYIDTIDYDVVREKEKLVKHDVMAHIYAYGKQAEKAAGIIHLGATSCYVTDNGDLVIYKDALKYVRDELKNVISKFLCVAEKYKYLLMPGYTHYQPAQFVTLGKRITLWCQDLIICIDNIEYVINNIKFLGCRGATGTEASFEELFGKNSENIDILNKTLANRFGFNECFDVSGQTYTRIVDSLIVNSLSLLASAVNKIATDIRLLQHDKFVYEPFDTMQIGSSAMPYKRNPVKCERICSLSRYLIVDAMNPILTHSNQWFERTLDDSANRRISMPEGFLCADSILRLLDTVISGIQVNEKIIEKAVKNCFPFVIVENIIMESVKKGQDRQKVHETIRKLSIKVYEEMEKGENNNLINYIVHNDSIGLTSEDINKIINEVDYKAHCAKQVETFVTKHNGRFKDISIYMEKIKV